MEQERTDLGELSDLGAVCRLIDITGLRLVDVGCGPGTVAGELAQLGATVLGIEPDPAQAEKNRRTGRVPGLTLIEGGGEALPLEDGSMDGVLFFRSLHHVPIGAMDQALAEAARVVKPDSGFVCVVEPGVTGTNFAVMRPFHDETEVRREAQAALARMGGTLFREQAYYRFLQHPRLASFDALVERYTGMTYNDISREQVETGEVRALFEQGRTEDGDYRFDQPMLLNLYRRPGQP